jgi:hypothetical protein
MAEPVPRRKKASKKFRNKAADDLIGKLLIDKNCE